MCKSGIILFYLLLCNLNIIFSQVAQNDLKVTYIANEGFLLETASNKILIDALFSEGYGAFQVPSKELTELIIAAETPFDSINLYLLTHYHKDHCDPELINKYLSKHKKVRFVTSKPSIVFIDGNCFGFIAKKKQFLMKTPELNQSISVDIDNIFVKACGMKHLSMYKNDIDLEELMFNVAYFFEVDGIRVFHSGDIEMNDYQNYLAENNKIDPVDIAFLYYNMLKNGNSDLEFIRKTLKPKHIVLMHVPLKKVDEIAEKTKELKNVFPNIYFFRNSMESTTIRLRKI